jgi:hypothetical protein
MSEPGFWKYEVSGQLARVVEAYLRFKPMSEADIAMMRAYLRQWINADGFIGPEIEDLRRRVDDLTSREALDVWLSDAVMAGADPL